MRNTSLLLSLLLFTLTSTAFARAKKPLALVWAGPGACLPSCMVDAAMAAKKAGFRVKLVNQHMTNFDLFKEAKLWVQPGGKSVTVAQSMSTELMSHLKEFVAGGGGYVGFCAGAFISTTKIGTSGEDGYGFVPGETELLVQEGPEDLILKISTKYFGTRSMLYAGGPYIKITEEELAAMNGEVIARYPNGSVAGVRGHYGKGKVAVVGFHPEADFFWKLFYGKIDHDGSDVFFAVDMMKYATAP